MKPEEVISIVGNTPHTSHAQGRALYDLIVKHRLRRCMELGFAHGVGSVWIAAALHEIGGGKLIAVDNLTAHNRRPTAREMIDKAGLSSYVELHYDDTSYNWHVHNHWDEYQTEKFDLIFLDGAHNWDVDALAFYLGDAILNKDGWFLFDDIYWSYAKSPALRDTPRVQAMSPEMRETQQVRSIWEKLVITSPNYGNFVDDGSRGWAQKVGEQSTARAAVAIQRPQASHRGGFIGRMRAAFSPQA